MARLRAIKPGFFLNEQLADVPPLGRLLFAGLWCIADREGRLEDRPRKIKAEVLPYDEVNVDELLTILHTAGFVLRYRVGEHAYIQVVNFTKHQSPHSREVPSAIPAPTQVVTEHDLGSDEASPRIPLTLTITRTITEREYAAKNENAVQAAQHLAPNAHASVRSPSQKKKKDDAEKTPKTTRPPNVIWDALTDVLHTNPATRTECSNWGKVCKELQEAGATPDEVRVRSARYIRRYGEEMLTINAILHHWSECATDMPITAINNSHNHHHHNNNTGGLPDAEDVRRANQERELAIERKEERQRALYAEKMRLYHDQTPMDP